MIAALLLLLSLIGLIAWHWSGLLDPDLNDNAPLVPLPLALARIDAKRRNKNFKRKGRS